VAGNSGSYCPSAGRLGFPMLDKRAAPDALRTGNMALFLILLQLDHLLKSFKRVACTQVP